jgi:hypothetical protein
MAFKKHLLVLAGLAIWLGLVYLRWPPPRSPDWIVCMLLLSPLVLMPLAVPLMNAWPGPGRGWSGLACAVAVVVSFTQISGRPAALLAAPWLLLRIIIACSAAQQFWQRRVFAAQEWCLLLAEALPAVGAAWLLAHRAGWQVMGFDALTILLTATHFHHAAFTLPLLAGWAARWRGGSLMSFACVGIIFGVLEVPLGITLGHLGHGAWPELIGVTVLVAGALALGWTQCALVRDAALPFSTRLALLLSGLSLMAAMVLALLYGARSVLPGLAPPMPEMWFIHGTLNAAGFGLTGICGWRIASAASQRAAAAEPPPGPEITRASA